MERAEILSLDSVKEEEGTVLPSPLQPGIMRLAVTLRALRQRSGAGAFFFTPVSPKAGWLVYQVADAISRFDPSPVLVVDIRSGRVEGVGLTPDSPAVAFGLLADLKQIAVNELAPAPTGRSLSARSSNAISSPMMLSERMLTFIAEAKRSFGYVLIDGPCLLTDPASALAASQCDGAILTVTRGRTKLRDVDTARRQLELAQVKVLGFVMEEAR